MFFLLNFLHFIAPIYLLLLLHHGVRAVKIKRKDPLLYFMSKPEDFENDPDVCFMAVKLHSPDTVESYYHTAAQTYMDLKQICHEIAHNRAKSVKWLEINRLLFEASFAAPLTVANMFFLVAKHLQPLLKYHSRVLDRISERILKLEETETETIATINRFFRHFSLPEMQFLELLCNLMSRAQVLKKAADSHSPSQRGFLDLSRTNLIKSQERIFLTLSNALAKADMLLTLFLTEPTAAERSLNLVQKLWHVHWRRWQLQNSRPVPTESFHFDTQNYQKEPIHFTFPDWNGDVDVEKEVALLQIRREKLMKRYEKEEALRRFLLRPPNSSSSKLRILVLVGVLVVGLVVGLTAAYLVIKRQGKATAASL
jgi:hypothetical protein